MSEKKLKKEIVIKNEKDFDNLVGFFRLLLKVDMRRNPDRYKLKNKEKYD